MHRSCLIDVVGLFALLVVCVVGLVGLVWGSLDLSSLLGVLALKVLTMLFLFLDWFCVVFVRLLFELLMFH